jgi:hypothetical protein
LGVIMRNIRASARPVEIRCHSLPKFPCQGTRPIAPMLLIDNGFSILRGRFWKLEEGFSLPAGKCFRTGKVTILRLSPHKTSAARSIPLCRGSDPEVNLILPRLRAPPPRQPNSSADVCGGR